MNTIKNLMVLAMVAMSLAACGSAKSVSVESAGVTSSELRSFDLPQDQRFSSVKLFLWRDDVQAEHIKTVSQVANEIDDSDLFADGLQRQMKPYKEKQEPLEKELKEAKARIRQIKLIQLPKLKKEKLAEEKKEAPDAERLAQLAAEISKLETEQGELEARSALIEKDVEEIKAKLTDLEAQFAENSAKGEDLVKKIKENVTWFDSLGTVSLDAAENGELQISWNNLNLGDDQGERDLSTENGLITNARFKPLGGFVSFDMHVHSDKETLSDLREIYHVEFARHRYDITDKEGRVVFNGKVVRTLVGQACERAVEQERVKARAEAREPRKHACRREGVIKMTDFNNR